MSNKSDPLKIVSLNIEYDRHLDRIIPFLKEQQPDVILLQEVLRKDVDILEEATGQKGVFTVQNILSFEHGDFLFGMLILSGLPILKKETIYYSGDDIHLVRMHTGEPEKTTRALSIIEVLKGDQRYCLVNIHFTWSPKSRPNAVQHQDLKSVLQHLSKIPEFILCGDFNAPRGTAIFDAIASRYKDNIPLNVVTTIDKNLHKAGDLGIVVDGIFTTPGYQVEAIKVLSDLSDHCALVAEINT